MTVGLFLLSNLSPQTSTLEAAGYMFVTGFGIGLVMQVLVVAVQNAVGYEELGVATSGNTLFRNIGSSVGTAMVGTIFATELASHLRADFPHASSAQLNTSHLARPLWPSSHRPSTRRTLPPTPTLSTRHSRWPASCPSQRSSPRGSSSSFPCAKP